MPPLVYPFLLLIAERDQKRDLRPFQNRDAVASMLAIDGLRSSGFEFGDVLLNFPPPRSQGRVPASVDTSFCRGDDLILTTTRLPLSDDTQDNRKRIRRAYTDLESELLAEWKPYLPILGRERVKLDDSLCDALPPGYEGRFDMCFYEAHGAPYRRLKAMDGRRTPLRSGNGLRTAAFLLRLPALSNRRTGYIGLWGLDGTATLVWAYLLRHRHADLLREPGFVMAELSGSDIPRRPTNLRWALDWNAKILIHQRLPQPGGRARRAA
jgi:hypothetical protein